MANGNLKDGMKDGDLIVEELSGNIIRMGRSIEMSEVTFLIQSGTYETQKSAGVPNPVTFTTAFSAAPKVILTPTQAAGLAPPIAHQVAASGFEASGAIAHTGGYIAFGMP